MRVTNLDNSGRTYMGHQRDEDIRLQVQAAYDVITVGASLGGLDALTILLRGIPRDFPAAVLIAQHTQRGSLLVESLKYRTGHAVEWAQEGADVRPGRLYVALPDRHLIVTEERTMALLDAPAVNYVRPSADVLFDSVASVYRQRAIGVVLTGRGRDGAIGARAIKDGGGRVLAQDKTTSLAFEMPHAAIATGSADFVLPLDQLAPALVCLVTVPGAADLFKTAPAFSLAHARRYRPTGTPVFQT